MISDFSAVNISCGEKTTDLSICSIKKAISDVICIKGMSQANAIYSALKTGLNQGKRYTVIIAADMVCYPTVLVEILDNIKELDKVFRYRILLKDKFHIKRYGIGVYVNKYLDTALKSYDFNNIIPEGNMVSNMVGLGYKVVSIPIIAGEHDFNQSDYDIYRKGYLWSHKLSIAQKQKFIPYWREKALLDRDYRVVLFGYEQGLLNKGNNVRCDVKQYDRILIENKILEVIK